MIKEIKISSVFVRHYRRLSREIKRRAKKKEEVFRENPFDPRLKTHKLHGKEKEVWAFWIDFDYRIKFIFLNDEEVLFLDIGPHRIYK